MSVNISKYTPAKTLLARYKHFDTPQYKENAVAEDAIHKLEETIKEERNPYAWVFLDEYGAFEDEKETDQYRYDKYTKKIRAKLISLGYEFMEEKDYVDNYGQEANYVLYMAVKGAPK